MRNNLNNPLLLKFFLLKIELFDLESIMDDANTDSWPEGYYNKILITTDKFYSVRNKLLKIFKDDDTIECLIYHFNKNGGNA